MRIKLRSILKKMGRIYPVSKLFVFLTRGLDSKNAKTRSECLEEIAGLIQRNGQSVFQPSKLIPLVALQVGDRDAPCRNAALTALCNIYEVVGEDLFKHTTKISDKDKDMITERIKRHQGKAVPLPRVALATMAGTKNCSPSRSSTPTGRISSSMPLAAVPKQFSLDLENLGLDMPKTRSFTQFNQDGFDTSENLPRDRLDVRTETLVSKLSNPDLEIAIESAKQIEKLIMANPSRPTLLSKDLVGSIFPSVNSAYNNLNHTDTLRPRFCKYLTSILIQVFSTTNGSCTVPYESLELTIRAVLFWLVDPALQIFDSSKNLSRSLNMLMVRIIDNCEPNSTLRALLLILREVSVQNELSSTDIQVKYGELVMKCLWKITKVIPSFLESGTLLVDLLLLEINSFLNSVPPQFWKHRILETGNSQADMPLRTVKTILHELVNALNENVMQFTNVLPEAQNHTTAYLRQMLLNVKKRSTAVVPKQEIDFSSRLDSIFVQIANKDETKFGIQRLFEIQKKYPSIIPLVNEKLSKTGTYFQGYIKRGLVSMEEKVTTSSVQGGSTEEISRAAEGFIFLLTV
jgi:cytoskeleton-associated protein 5